MNEDTDISRIARLLADPARATMLGALIDGTRETLAVLGAGIAPRASRHPPPRRTIETPFIYARTCYDHLAGEAAVRICEGMLKARWLAADGREFAVTPLGKRKLAALGIDIDSARRKRRAFARACVDLTQRRPHLGGALGAALLEVCVDRGWVLRNPRSRVVNITPKGAHLLSGFTGLSRRIAEAQQRRRRL